MQKYQLQHEMKTLNFQEDRFLHWIIKIIWGISSKNGSLTGNPQILIYVNKVETELYVKFRRYYLKLLTPETIKLLGSTKKKTNKNENVENVSQLKFTEVILVHCNVAKNDYQHDSRVF